MVENLLTIMLITHREHIVIQSKLVMGINCPYGPISLYFQISHKNQDPSPPPVKTQNEMR